MKKVTVVGRNFFVGREYFEEDSMIHCKECGEDFESRTAAEDHVVDAHADICDRYLEEYIGESQREAQENLLEGEE